jgi:hypothetical protein
MNGRKHFEWRVKIGSKAQVQVKKTNGCKDFFFWKQLKPHVGTLAQPLLTKQYMIPKLVKLIPQPMPISVTGKRPPITQVPCCDVNLLILF